MITAFIKMDGKNFQFSVKKNLNGRKIHPYWETFPSKKTYRLSKVGIHVVVNKVNSEISRSYLPFVYTPSMLAVKPY